MKLRMSKYVFTILLATAISVGSACQDPAEELVLDLKEAVDYAMAYNKSLKNSRFEVERSRRSIWEAISQGLPQVDGAVDYMTYFNYELAFSFGMGEDFDFTDADFAEAMSQTLSQPQF